MSAHPDALIRYVAEAIGRARASDAPFFHLEFNRIVPDDVYAAMLQTMPGNESYRAMAGRSRDRRTDGRSTRVKLDLLPEYTRRLAPVWDQVGRALTSRAVQDAFVRRLEPGMRRRFGDDFTAVGLYPIPILTRDIAGYHIAPHTDTKWKGITVQIYLPRDDRLANIGTVFHTADDRGRLSRASQMRFAPNSGYAFAVGDDTWHSVDRLGDEVETRDSILLTYFVDAGWFRFLRNRAKRAGNLVEHWLRLARR